MSLRHPKASAGGHPPMRMLLATVAVVFTLAPGIPGAGAGTGGNTDDDAQIVADAKRVEIAIVAAYNDKKWDELRPLFTEDALLLPPNHEPPNGGTPSSSSTRVPVTLWGKSPTVGSSCV